MLPVQFTIDHVIPIKQDGLDDLENLALACFHCNRYKSNRQAAIDPETQQMTDLFNPRNQAWEDHFIWSADKLTLLGQSAMGRATINALKLNRERIQLIREADLAVNRHPPKDDLVLDSLP
jgi:hypothetical protein